jgi:hypothetical protein
MKNASPMQSRSRERLHERRSVIALDRARRIRPLCHVHHFEMNLIQVLLRTENEATQTDAYVCPMPSCLVHYNNRHGYFITKQNGNGIERDMTPRVACSQDGVRMYLAEVRPTLRSFRLWRCPQCGMSHTSQRPVLANNGASVQAPTVENSSEPTNSSSILTLSSR